MHDASEVGVTSQPIRLLTVCLILTGAAPSSSHRCPSPGSRGPLVRSGRSLEQLSAERGHRNRNGCTRSPLSRSAAVSNATPAPSAARLSSAAAADAEARSVLDAVVNRD